jgi:hypothetical protein
MSNFAKVAYLGMVLTFGLSGAALSRDAGPGRLSDAPSGSSQVSGHPHAGHTVMPISVENGQVIINVTINGQGPFPMMFDSGAEEAVTPETASALGLEMEGGGTVRGSGEGVVPVTVTNIKSLRVGDAELSDLRLPVLPLPRFYTDRGTRPPVAGLVGHDLLAQFAVRLDYESRTLTLTPARAFHYSEAGTRVPLFFADKLPVVPAFADGIEGRFEIDTGSSEAIVPQRRFVDQYGFESSHPGRLRMKVGGVDEVFETIAARLDSFTIAKAEIERPVVEFPSGGKSGLSVVDVDGSIGYQILRQFVITFDYLHQSLWFQRSAAFGDKTAQWKTGFPSR